MAILRRLGANGNAQQIYELCFILWALSLVISSPSRNGEEVELKEFLSSGAVQALAELLVSSPTKKVGSLFFISIFVVERVCVCVCDRDEFALAFDCIRNSLDMIVKRFLAW